MKTKRHCDPWNTNSRLGQIYLQHYKRVMKDTQPKIMGHVAMNVLDGIESFATDNPKSRVNQMWKEMLQAIGPGTPAGDPDAVEQFSTLYKNASEKVFSATSQSTEKLCLVVWTHKIPPRGQEEDYKKGFSDDSKFEEVRGNRRARLCVELAYGIKFLWF